MSTVNIPDDVIERLKRATGKRTSVAALNAAITEAIARGEGQASRPRVSLARLVGEEPKSGKRFSDAASAVRYLKSVR